MKKFLFLVLIFTVINSLQAQQEVNQKMDSIAVESNKSTISYKLILEYGGSTGMERYYYKNKNYYNKGDREAIRTAYSRMGLSLTAINNIAFHDRFLLGIGGEIEYRSLLIVFPAELAGSCFLNFRYYFNKPNRLLIPMFNIAIGGRITKRFDVFWPTYEERFLYGIYSTFGAGFKVKLFSLQGGVLFWTKGDNLFGVDAMVKVGLNF